MPVRDCGRSRHAVGTRTSTPSFNIPSAQAGHAVQETDIDYDGDGHLFQSREFHAAAAVEGFGHFIAVAAWHNLSDSTINYVSLPEEGLGGQVDDSYNLIQLDAWGCFDYVAGMTINCGAGRSNELNWASALVAFYQSSSEPSIATIAGMLSAAHAPPWYPNGTNDDFVDDFDSDMQSYLSMAEYADWSVLVVEWELD